MRILYITLEDLSNHKGSVTHIREMVDGLSKRGHRVDLIASHSGQSEKMPGLFNLERVPGFILKFFGRTRQPYLVSSACLFAYLFRLLPGYDVLYARDFHTVIIALLPRLLFKKKVVFEVNGIASEERRMRSRSIRNRAWAFLIERAERVACAYADQIISVTPQIASYLIQRYGAESAKIVSISNGVDTGKFYPIKDKRMLGDMRTRLGIDAEDPVVVFVGNLAPWQGVELLIEAASEVIRAVKRVKFLIIGDGRSREGYEGQIERLGLKAHFILTGMVDHREIPLYINLSDICVLPKRRLRSGYSPVKLYEYMACGKPVVATRVEGLDVIEEAGAGRLTDTEDRRGLEEALKELLVNPQKREEMGRKGLRMVRERFDWRLKVIEVEGVLKNLAQDSHNYS